MFTVLYVDAEGSEWLNGDVASVRTHTDYVAGGGGAGVVVQYTNGTSDFYPASKDAIAVPRSVIVMNEHGKTVAKWDL